jgi:hypothetical protein
MTKVIDVDVALNASKAAQEALESATALVERKQLDLSSKVSAAKTAIEVAQNVAADLLADAGTSAVLPRALLEKAMNANEKSSAMLKTAADLISAVGIVGTITSPIDEWKECRVTIDRFDKILVDLRKTGFGFVTAIAAAAQFLFTDVYFFGAKVALLAMLVFLIITLYLIDLAHQEWLDVAVERAKLIEKDRFSEAIFLTSAISDRFSPFRAIRLGFLLYAVLLIATCAVFFFSVPRNEIWLSGHHCFVGLICGVGLAFLGGACGSSVFRREGRKVVPSQLS